MYYLNCTYIPKHKQHKHLSCCCTGIKFSLFKFPTSELLLYWNHVLENLFLKFSLFKFISCSLLARPPSDMLYDACVI